MLNCVSLHVQNHKIILFKHEVSCWCDHLIWGLHFEYFITNVVPPQLLKLYETNFNPMFSITNLICQPSTLKTWWKNTSFSCNLWIGILSYVRVETLLNQNLKSYICFEILMIARWYHITICTLNSISWNFSHYPRSSTCFS